MTIKYYLQHKRYINDIATTKDFINSIVKFRCNTLDGIYSHRCQITTKKVKKILIID